MIFEIVPTVWDQQRAKYRPNGDPFSTPSESLDSLLEEIASCLQGPTMKWVFDETHGEVYSRNQPRVKFHIHRISKGNG